MAPLTGDIAYFIHEVHGKFRDVIGIHVDDAIGLGNKDFVEISNTERKFESKPREYIIITFVRNGISKQCKSYLLHQTLYARRLN